MHDNLLQTERVQIAAQVAEVVARRHLKQQFLALLVVETRASELVRFDQFPLFEQNTALVASMFALWLEE